MLRDTRDGGPTAEIALAFVVYTVEITFLMSEAPCDALHPGLRITLCRLTVRARFGVWQYGRKVTRCNSRDVPWQVVERRFDVATTLASSSEFLYIACHGVRRLEPAIF